MVIADNNYIDLLVNFGIIGTCLYYLLYIYGFKEWLNIKNKNILDVALPVSILIMLLVIDYGVSSYLYLHSQTLLAISICWLKKIELEEKVDSV